MLFGILLVSIAAIAVLGTVGFLISRKKGEAIIRNDTENVADLNDRFNRARHMNEDGN